MIYFINDLFYFQNEEFDKYNLNKLIKIHTKHPKQTKIKKSFRTIIIK